MARRNGIKKILAKKMSSVSKGKRGKKGDRLSESIFAESEDGKMITKLMKDHIIKQTPTCGEIREILLGTEYSPNIAIALDIRPTKAHYHKGFDEIYFVLDGDLILKVYNPETGESIEQKLGKNELCVITKGIHHKIIESSANNRLCVITVPRFNAADEYLSEKI